MAARFLLQLTTEEGKAHFVWKTAPALQARVLVQARQDHIRGHARFQLQARARCVFVLVSVFVCTCARVCVCVCVCVRVYLALSPL